jgi:putative membrane protein
MACTDDKPSGPTAPGDPRVYLAAERTLLAWVRTGLAMMGFGFVVARFGLFLRELALANQTPLPPTRPAFSLWAGVAMVLLGVWVCAAGAFRHAAFRRRFKRGEPELLRGGHAVIGLALALAVIGVAVAAHLILVGR